jgi:dystrophin
LRVVIIVQNSQETRETEPIDAAGFQNALEPILMWLLDAQDTLSRQKPIADEVQTVKEQFQEHEVK